MRHMPCFVHCVFEELEWFPLSIQTLQMIVLHFTNSKVKLFGSIQKRTSLSLLTRQQHDAEANSFAFSYRYGEYNEKRQTTCSGTIVSFGSCVRMRKTTVILFPG